METLVDARGNPINMAAIREPQTAKVASLYQEYSTHPARGLTPTRLNSLLVNAETGDLTAQADLFDDMEERDAHLQAEMGKRKRAILTLDWQIKPPKNPSAAETKLAAEVEERLRDIDEFDEVLTDALSAVGHAFACLEIEWDRLNGWLMPKSLDLRPQSWFQMDIETRTQIRLRSMDGYNGAALNPFGWIVHVSKAKSGYLPRAGLFRSLAWPYLFKNYAARDLAEFLEIYGLPLRLGKYPNGATPEEKATLMRAVVNIGHAAAGIIPEGMMIDFQNAANGTHEPHIAMIEWCERTESLSILGQNVGNDSAKKGSLAGMSVDNDVRLDILESDARQLGNTLTRDLVFPLISFNKGQIDYNRCPRLVFDVEQPEDLQLYSDALPKLAEAGLQIPVSWAQGKLHIPEPKDGEAVMKGAPAAAASSLPGQNLPDQTQQTGQSPPDKTQKAALSAMRYRPVTNPPDTQDHLTDALQRETVPAMQDLLEQVRGFVENANDLAQLRDMLIDAYGSLNSSKLADVMALGLATANLSGRFDLATESSLLPEG